MKNLFEMVSSWFSTSQARSGEGATAVPVSVPEHERRLRELVETGRVVFLP